MPFIDSQNLVVEKDDLPSITQKEKDDKQNYPNVSSLILLQGGQGGAFGEKSYKPKVILANVDLQSYDFNLNEADINKCSTTEIKSENDCGYAINFKTDASNQCDFTLGEYDPYNNLNIYAPSQLLPFSYLYTGGVSSSAVLASGSAVGDFTLQTFTGAYYLSGNLDTELNLNKYYLELRNSGAINEPFYLQKSIDFNLVDNSVFIFYVAQTDLVSGYATYNTGVITFNNNTIGIASVTGGFYDTLFSENDLIRIEHPSGYYNAKAKITAKNASTNVYTFKITESGNFPRTNSVSFPLGSSVSIFDEESNKLSICAQSNKMPSDAEGYNNHYSDPADGFQFKIDKKVTTNHKELSNSLSFTFDKKLLNLHANAIEIKSSFPRIGNRKYMQDQYGTDLVKNQIKNKSKFNIFYHGLERNLSQSNNNNIQAVTTYSCGNEVSSFVSSRQINQDILAGLLPDSPANRTVNLIVGSPLRSILQVKRSYYSNRIYEVLIYINLKSSDIPKVLAGLSKKYSQKTNFSSPVEFQTSDMYYSTADKINILGKIKKTST